MTQEEKQLLLKDLCARLPYGVKVKYYRDMCDGTLHTINFKFTTVWITADNGSNDSLDFEDIGKGIWQLKPYLRPMSSLVGKELDECRATCKYRQVGQSVLDCATPETIDYLISRHFDYRGLIPMGLALEAPEDMYKIEQL